MCQIIDGLHCRHEDYDKTARCLEGEDVGHFVPEDVTDADEARNMAEVYSRLIRILSEELTRAASSL